MPCWYCGALKRNELWGLPMRRYFVLCAAFILTACGSTHDLKKDGFNLLGEGGFIDQEVRPGLFLIKAFGNSFIFQSVDGAKSTFSYRATQLCPSGYREVRVLYDYRVKGTSKIGHVLCNDSELPFVDAKKLVTPDIDETPEWLEKAHAGDAQAQLRLSSAYEFGIGVPPNGDEAMRWMRASADQGYAEAQNSMGSVLQFKRQYSSALEWYVKASNQGHPRATNNLAYLYDMGLGVAQDRKLAFDLYSKSANLGWAEAMWNLAQMYGLGQIGDVNLTMACTWFVRAQKYGDPKNQRFVARASDAVRSALEQLPPDEALACKSAGENWVPLGR